MCGLSQLDKIKIARSVLKACPNTHTRAHVHTCMRTHTQPISKDWETC